jgi:hypothetical protein
MAISEQLWTACQHACDVPPLLAIHYCITHSYPGKSGNPLNNRILLGWNPGINAIRS